ncbi:hypothetical protein [Streptomyces sp. NPDC005262]|uniref:hypothetical protein n=1 Tax=Streptomyces sp. NPDC005262 TaxID=3364710 RepID=UPI0036B0F759
MLADSDPDARNTLTDPDRVTPHPAQDTTLDGAVLRATLEPMSWNMIRLTWPRTDRPPGDRGSTARGSPARPPTPRSTHLLPPRLR